MRIRLALGVAVAGVTALGLVAVASACYGPAISITQGSAAPGDTVTYSIVGTDPGAEYWFTVNGVTISGKDTGEPGEQGTFTMPECSSGSVDIAGGTNHTEDGTPGSLSESVACNIPAPAGASPTAPPAASPVEHRDGIRHAGRPQLSETVKHAAGKPEHGSASVSPIVGSPPAGPSVGSDPGPRDPRGGSGAAKPAATESASVPHRVLDAVTATTKVGPADVPTIGLLAMALIFVAGTALAAFVIYLLRRGPDPEAAIKAPAPLGHDPVEVELQEMIAEEMARQLLNDLDLGERTVRSR